ncbi:T9SS type B sorting domain-containing protein [Flavicella sediminum]|uniref:T9SS type B sorting domain-containing protein n=1 Tax=Flavicella sediminum TaxID=2585141 RepID=UPI001120F80E|nr:T9SS type B sorting domain-containing protein [Flavicella sediminum]
MKRILLYFLLFFGLSIHAQKEANIWYFGEEAGLDFNSGIPTALIDGKVDTNEGCATISDKNGQLLFYTDGITVWNKNHTVMLNGNSLNGHPSSTHSAMIVPQPHNANVYYIFNVNQYNAEKGFWYSKVDMTLDGNLGGIVSTEKNIRITSTLVTENLTAIKNIHTQDYWVVSHAFNGDEFLAFKVTNAGIDLNYVSSHVGSFLNSSAATSSAIGAMKFSPNGQRLAIARGSGVGKVAELQVFDFDTATGKVSNPLTFYDSTIPDEDFFFYGLEFSPNSQVLYTSVIQFTIVGDVVSNSASKIHQYNLNAGNNAAIEASKTTLFSYPNSSVGALQLATDKKIYVSVFGKSFLDAIEKPDELAAAAQYTEDAVFLGGKRALYGLPPFIQTYFTTTINFEHVCLGQPTNFYLANEVDSILWDFDDPDSGVENTSVLEKPVHIFTNPGSYEVSATFTESGDTKTIRNTVEIYDLAMATKPEDLVLCETDNDGFYLFDLSTQNNAILNGLNPTEYNVRYYAGIADYNAKKSILTPENYRNKRSYTEESIYAEVYQLENDNCASAPVDFTISLFESSLPPAENGSLSSCDNSSFGSDEDGRIMFDLSSTENYFLNGQSKDTFLFEYYTDSSLLNKITNPKTFVNTQLQQTIHVSITNKFNTKCSTVVLLDLEVFALPIIEENVVLKQCDDDIDGFSDFNLTEVDSKISTEPTNVTISYFETLAGAEANNAAELIINPTSYRNATVSTDTVWARVTTENSCYRISEISLVVSTTAIPANFKRNFYECDDYLDAANPNTDGITAFNFESVKEEIKALFPLGQELIVQFYRNNEDALKEVNAIENAANYRNIGYPNQQDIYVRVDSKRDNDCLGFGKHISLFTEPMPIAHPVGFERQCDDDFDGRFPFDTSTLENDLLKGQTGMVVQYFGQNGTELPSPLPNPFVTTSQFVKVVISLKDSKDPDGACTDETYLQFLVDKKSVANNVAPLEMCDDDHDGIFLFDTSTIDAQILNGQTDMEISYFDTNGNPLPSPLPNPFSTNTTRIRAQVTNTLNGNCVAATSIDFVVFPKPIFELETDEIVCLNLLPKRVSIKNPSENTHSYIWTNNLGEVVSTQPTAEIVKEGKYTVIATSLNGCESFPMEMNIKASNIASLTKKDLKIIDDSENNSLEIIRAGLGIGDYEYALQKENNEIGAFQNEALFDYLDAGVYKVYVNDKNNCGLVDYDFSIIGFPKFFTPNGDGSNDYWRIQGITSQFYPNTLVAIYDKMGRLLAEIDPLGMGWDGTSKGLPCLATDYWFVAKLIDKQGQVRHRYGNFSLLR